MRVDCEEIGWLASYSTYQNTCFSLYVLDAEPQTILTTPVASGIGLNSVSFIFFREFFFLYSMLNYPRWSFCLALPLHSKSVSTFSAAHHGKRLAVQYYYVLVYSPHSIP